LVSLNIQGQNIGLMEHSGTKVWSRGIFADKILVSWNIPGQKIGLPEYSGANVWSRGIFRGQNLDRHLKLLALYVTRPNFLPNRLN
jgi:hypothetical protein